MDLRDKGNRGSHPVVLAMPVLDSGINCFQACFPEAAVEAGKSQVVHHGHVVNHVGTSLPIDKVEQVSCNGLLVLGVELAEVVGMVVLHTQEMDG